MRKLTLKKNQTFSAMAALTVLVLCASQEIFRVGVVFLSSGFSLSNCITYIKTARQQYLYERYLKEFQMSDNNQEGEPPRICDCRKTLAAARAARKDKGKIVKVQDGNVDQIKGQQNLGKQKSSVVAKQDVGVQVEEGQFKECAEFEKIPSETKKVEQIQELENLEIEKQQNLGQLKSSEVIKVAKIDDRRDVGVQVREGQSKEFAEPEKIPSETKKVEQIQELENLEIEEQQNLGQLKSSEVIKVAKIDDRRDVGVQVREGQSKEFAELEKIPRENEKGEQIQEPKNLEVDDQQNLGQLKSNDVTKVGNMEGRHDLGVQVGEGQFMQFAEIEKIPTEIKKAEQIQEQQNLGKEKSSELPKVEKNENRQDVGEEQSKAFEVFEKIPSEAKIVEQIKELENKEQPNFWKQKSSEVTKVEKIEDRRDIGVQVGEIDQIQELQNLEKHKSVKFESFIGKDQVVDHLEVEKFDTSAVKGDNVEERRRNNNEEERVFKSYPEKPFMQVEQFENEEIVAHDQIIQPSVKNIEGFDIINEDVNIPPLSQFQLVDSEAVETLQGIIQLDNKPDFTGHVQFDTGSEDEEFEKMTSPELEEIEKIEIIDGVEAKKSTFYDAIDPNLVYSNANLDVLTEGVSLIVTGKILPNCERFSVNLVLENPHRDVALHINPRLPQNYIVRNCRVKKLWGPEEVTSALPFILRRGSKFTIQILVTDTQYLISVNGRHFASFRHRLPYQQVTCLEVKGDVEAVAMNRIVISDYPSRMPGWEPVKIRTSQKLSHVDTQELLATRMLLPQRELCDPGLEMPFYGVFEDPFESGTVLLIEGRVKILPHSFFLNLQKGQNIWPHPLIAFHFNPRFANTGGKHVICRNSWVDGKWSKEERSELKTDFLPGNNFTIKIYCTNTAYEVFLNDKFIADYKFRVKPNQVDTLYVQGDVKLWEVVLRQENLSEMNL